jgi:hypothetical protein
LTSRPSPLGSPEMIIGFVAISGPYSRGLVAAPIRDSARLVASLWTASEGQNRAMIGRLQYVVIDCPEPRALGMFYSEVVGLPRHLRIGGRGGLRRWHLLGSRLSTGPESQAAAQARPRLPQ